MTADRVLDELSRVVEAARGHRQPPEVEHAAKRMIMDSVGCALGAFREQVPGIARAAAAARPQPGGCSVLGTRISTTPEMAAFANGVMIRYLDYNDAYGSAGGIGHPSDYIPAAMAAAERAGACGADLLAAVSVGYEVFCRLTDATRLGVETWDHVVNGAVASAAAAALTGGLPAGATRHAMSLALTPNFALQATRLGNLSMWKGCASGNACRNGMFAAELAGRGLTGPEAPFEGRGGLFPVLGGEPDLRGLLRADGRPAISDCHIKRYPSGYFSQGAIEAAVQARAGLRSSQEVERIEVGTFEFGLRVMAGDEQKWHPTTRETADHSIPFVVACAVATGDVTSVSFRPEVLADPEIARLLAGLTVAVDPECAAAWPGACMNKVTLVLNGGERRSATVRYYRGHAYNPMNDEELQQKFAEQAVPVLGDAAADQLAAVIWGLDKAEHITELFDVAATAED